VREHGLRVKIEGRGQDRGEGSGSREGSRSRGGCVLSWKEGALKSLR
jgi:hypothetical protein